MDKTEAAERITGLKKAMGADTLASRLGIKRTHTFDLCKGRRGVSRPIAERLEEITGTPWHEWIPPAPDKKPSEARAA